MKIIQVVTYLSEDGAYGGPTRVAQAQCKALAQLGHEVILFAAAPIKKTAITRTDGYELVLVPAKRLHKSLGFAGMYAPQMRKEILKRLKGIDVAHIHLARDLVTLPAAKAIAAKNIPMFFQTHGMIDASQRLLALPVDLLLTKPLLRVAKKVFVLTDQEELDIEALCPAVPFERIVNGIEIGELPPYENRQNKVVFLSRLQERKRPVAFVEMAALVSQQLPEVTFEIAGSDEGQLETVKSGIAELGLESKVKVVGPIKPENTNEFLRAAKVFVLPSYGEIFPMVLLEAFAMGTPAVVTDSLGMVNKCLELTLASVTSGEANALSAEVIRIINDAELADVYRENSHAYLRGELDINLVASFLTQRYGDSL